MKDVHDNLLPTDSAYFRARYPEEWFWSDVQTRLIGKAATAMEKVHFLLARQQFEEIPPEFGFSEYGPPVAEVDDEPEPEPVDDSAARARAVAASMRG